MKKISTFFAIMASFLIAMPAYAFPPSPPGGSATTTTVDSSGFGGNLGIADTTVQAALETLDVISLGGDTTETNQDDAWAVLPTGTQTLITVTYQDGTNDVDFVVNSDLHNYSWTNVDATDLKVGSVTQAYDADLTTYAGITPSANVQSLLGAADYAAMRTLLDLEAGTDFYSISATANAISAAINAMNWSGGDLSGTGLAPQVIESNVDFTGLANISAIGSSTSIGITTGNNYTNFGSVTDDSINEMFAAIDAAWGGAGTISKVGDCTGGDCLDGSSDGGTYIRLYDGNSNYTSLSSSDVSATTAIVLPATAGTLTTSAEVLILTNTTPFTPDQDYEPATKKYVDDNIAAGAVSDVGDCAGGSCFDGTSDGGTYLRFFDGDANYHQLAVTNASGDVTHTFQAITGTIYETGGTDVSLADGGTGASLADPNGDRILFWDDVPGGMTWLSTATNVLQITGTELSLANHATARAALGVSIGSQVQAWDVFLDNIGALTDTNQDQLMGWDDSAGAVAWFDADTDDFEWSTTTFRLVAQIPHLDVAEQIDANWVNTAYPWADNEVADNLTISAGTVNNTPIGASTASTGRFTTLTTTGATTLGGNVALGTNEIQSTSNVVVQLGDAAGANSFTVQSSTNSNVFSINSLGGVTMAATVNPYMVLDQLTATDYWIGGYDTTVDRLEFRRSVTVNTNVDMYLDSTGLSLASGSTYKINGTQINIGNLGVDGNWAPTGTINFTSATLQNVGAGTITSGASYPTISNNAADDTINEMMAAIETWASGVSAGSLAALSDVVGVDYTGGTILVGDNSNSFDQKAVSGDATLAANGVLTIAAEAIEESMLKAVNAPTDEDILTYDSDVGDFLWQTPAELGLLAAANPVFTGIVTLPTAADPTTDAAGEMAVDLLAWDSARDAIEFYDGTASTYLVGVLASDAPSNGQTLQWNTGGTITWETPAGGGTVTGVGDCSSGDCLDGSSDGGAAIIFYNATGGYTVTLGGAAAVGASKVIDLAELSYLDGATSPLQSQLTSQFAYFDAFVADAGDCASGACFDGTSDGGTYIRIWDGDSNYAEFQVPDISSNITYNFPQTTGSIPVGPAAGFITFTGPTVARSYALPDAATTILTTNATVTVAQGGTGATTAATAATALGVGASSAVQFASVVGSVTLAGDPTLAANTASPGANGIIFEGSANDANEGLLTWPVTTSDKTITLPNATGYVPLNPTTTIGDLVYSTTTATPGTMGRIAAVALGSVLTSKGTGTAPAWDSAPQITNINLGHASDTTLARVSAGVISVGGVTLPRIIASGTTALNPGATSTGVCSAAATGTATGTATTDRIIWNPNGDVSGITGYNPASDLGYIWAYPTADNVNFKFCNKSGSSITPGSITLNWMVVR